MGSGRSGSGIGIFVLRGLPYVRAEVVGDEHFLLAVESPGVWEISASCLSAAMAEPSTHGSGIMMLSR